jgi:hypothetical protein
VTRFIVPLRTRHDRELAKRAIERAPEGYVADIKESSRSLEQNRALHGLIHQIMRQRTHHNGIRMSLPKWKALFMDALGEEVEFIPNLDGTGVVPMGLSTRELSVERFSQLIELILAWCAREGLEIKHFDAAEAGGSGSNANPRRERAA